MRDELTTQAGTNEGRGDDVASLSDLGETGARLGHDVVSLAGFLDTLDARARAQTSDLAAARQGSDDVLAANAAVIAAVGTVTETADRTLGAVDASVEVVRGTAEQARHVAEWVQALDQQMSVLAETLANVRGTNEAVSSIASQVNILAINAKIEAARAGESGRGFGVVAEAINDLSHKTARAAEAIHGSVRDLTQRIDTMQAEASGVAREAQGLLSHGNETDEALRRIATSVQTTREDAGRITAAAREVEAAGRAFAPGFDRIASGIGETATDINRARDRLHGLVDQSERIVQTTVALGGSSADASFIDYVQDRAAEIGQIFETAVADGEIGRGALFDFHYAPVPGTDPQQLMAPFTALTDRLLTGLQDRALNFDRRVVFCAAVTRDGYLPTHNRRFSRPQRPGDPVWNAANARNRRLFNDRVGLKAGRNTRPFLLQIYRRDMGGGSFAMMKDLSAPIFVDGSHWGGLRLAYAL